ncbi:hypothetical protein ONZ45_g16548 [Pleurotus djamor]|nr:hypothetical protein ONZ45_g16548 [Pleurotus djamor]
MFKFKFIVLTFLFASFPIQGFKVTDPIATPGQIKADVKHIDTSFKALRDAVDALPVDKPTETLGMTVLTIHAISAMLSSDLNTASLHLKIVDTLPDDDSRVVLSAIRGIEPTINSTVHTHIP